MPSFQEKRLRNEDEPLKAARIASAGGRRRTSFSYLFLSAVPLSAPVHFGNIDIPARKHRISLRKRAVLFYRRLGKRASFVMDHRERSTMRIVHCRCIKDLRHRQLHRRQNGRSLSRARDCPRLTLLKVH